MIRSENEDFCGTEEMVSPLGFQRPSPPGAALYGSISLNNDPPVFDWSRWGVIRSENENFCDTEEMEGLEAAILQGEWRQHSSSDGFVL